MDMKQFVFSGNCLDQVISEEDLASLSSEMCGQEPDRMEVD